MKKIAFKTLGCRLNQYETDAIASQFAKGGEYKIVDFDDQADVYIINTCTVTNQSDQKCRNIINQASKNKEGMLVVTGCMVNNHKSVLEKDTKATYLIENSKKSSLFTIVDSHLKGEIPDIDKIDNDLFGYQSADKTFHTRSMVKIQDGCDNHCTFCIIPDVRGHATSRPVEEVLQNIRELLDFGYKEIVLTGVNIGRYEYEGHSFDDLVEKVLELDGDFRVRISSIEPDGFSDKLFDLFENPKLCRHLHLCLQSGSDKVLLQMRRMYSTQRYMEMIENLRSRYPDFNFTTDIIVGFPNESEEDFQQTCDLAQEVGFSHIHTFRYSIRKGTRAERMPNQIPEKIKIERSKKIRTLANELQQKYRSSFVGKKQVVLTEKIMEGNKVAHGYGEHYMPIQFFGQNLKKNTFYEVEIDGIRYVGEEWILTGEII